MEKSIIKAIRQNPINRVSAKNAYLCSDGAVRFPKALAQWAELPWETMKKRMSIYGILSPLVFYVGKRIPKHLSEPARLTKPKRKPKYDLEPIEAFTAEDGGILARSGRTIPAPTSLESQYFPDIPAATGTYKQDKGISRRDVKGDEYMSTAVAKQLVDKFNERALNKGYLTKGDFLNPLPRNDWSELDVISGGPNRSVNR